ncbi:MAG: polyprenyl diphosphate synthase [Acidimicrobiales bacterium]
MSSIDPRAVPHHIACVMDGNGRWAQQRDLPRIEGHKMGEHALFEAVEGALDLGVEWLTVYAFSTENWKRPPDEVKFLINFNEDILLRRMHELNDRGVQIRFVGRNDWRVPKRLLRRMDEARELTKNNRTLVFTIAFNYGGRAEIVDAVRSLMDQGISPDKVTEKMLAKHLYDPQMPEVDLMIRTSGEFRTSNFLLWQLAYSEMWFTDTLWPDFTRQTMADAVYDFQHRTRRYGGVTA